MVFNLMQMVHANLCVSLDNIAVVSLSRQLFISQRNSRLQSQEFEEQNKLGQLPNSDETA